MSALPLRRLAAIGAVLAVTLAAASCTTTGTTAEPPMRHVDNVGPSAASTPEVAHLSGLGASPSPSSEPTGSPTRSIPTGPPAATTAGWRNPAFSEDFSSSLRDSVWSVYDDPNGDSPRSEDAVSIANGYLNITGGFNAAGKDVSGGVGSRIDQMYGRWSVRFRVDKGAGYSAVVLLWPDNDSDWPQAGEVDIAEIANAPRAKASTFVHYGQDNHQVSGQMIADFTKWHTVSVEWTPSHLAFYLDGKLQKFQVNGAHTPAAIPHMERMHLTLQLDKGCDDWTPCRDSSTPPKVVMQVDWVKIYAF
jgi:glycosyl hydrolase family 16